MRSPTALFGRMRTRSCRRLDATRTRRSTCGSIRRQHSEALPLTSIAIPWADGFRSFPIATLVLIESPLLVLPGAMLGTLVVWLLFNGHAVSTESVVFRLRVTPQLLGVSLWWALAIGLSGGALPALRAARSPVETALRAG
jgi:hypothetical protein